MDIILTTYVEQINRKSIICHIDTEYIWMVENGYNNSVL